ncbi:MAG: MMPL family transporter [Solirubrobacterales bacterium]
MKSVFDFVTGRRTKYLVFLFWILLLVATGSKAADFEKVQVNTSESFLPGSAESLKAIELEQTLPGGEQLPGLVVFQRDSGLTDEDRTAVEQAADSLNANPLEGQVGKAIPSFADDGNTATLYVAYEATGEDERLTAAKERLDAITEQAPDGLAAFVTGGIGYAADATEVFDSLNTTLLLGTALVVITLLLLIYRSPILWIIPLLSVLFAEGLTRAAGTLIAEAGAVVNGQSAGIMTVMVFGVGTDYALLLVSRYREELRRHEDTHEAMRAALHASVPAIVASASTVASALFVLLLADSNSTQALGPIAAVGVLIAMFSMLTLLPALMLIVGRFAFWPFVPRYRSDHEFAARGFWAKLGQRVRSHPRRTWLAMILLMGVLALGWTEYSEGLNENNSYVAEVDSVRGEELLKKSLPPGATGPTIVIVKGDEDAVTAATQTLRSDPQVAVVDDNPISANGVTRIQATLKTDPFAEEARASIPRLRASLDRVEDAEIYVGGQSAEAYDQRKTAKRDNQLIIPVALVLVLLILIALLRAVTLPLVLMATVIASFFASLGASLWVFTNVFGFPGIDPGLPLFVFIFLVALGVDYNIFLMARAREETLKVGSDEGMMRALIATGGVITSAGIVLAGTFSILATLPLVFMVEIGFAVAFGILFDALLVRSVLVPALVWDIGARVWWPSALTKRS